MPSLSEELQEVRSRVEVCLYSGGRVVEVRAGVMAMANLPLPPCSKYHHIAAETMVIENSFGRNRKEVRLNKRASNGHSFTRNGLIYSSVAGACHRTGLSQSTHMHYSV